MVLRLKPGDPFPDLSLPDHTGQDIAISALAAGRPLFLAFYRGYW